MFVPLCALGGSPVALLYSAGGSPVALLYSAGYPNLAIFLLNDYYHSVGCTTFSMMPMSSIRFYSARTLGSNGIGILRGVVRLNGVTPSLSLTSYSSGIQPSLANTSGCGLFM